MKVVVVLGSIVLAAATALMFNDIVTTRVAAVAVQVSGASREPALLLVSGSLLLGLAGAMKRFTL